MNLYWPGHRIGRSESVACRSKRMITIYIQDITTRIPMTEIQCHLLQSKMNSMDINTKILEGGTAQLAAVAVGILAHLFVFRIGEWDLATTSLIVSFFGFQLVSAAALSNLASNHVSLFDAQIIVSRLAFLVLGGTFSSMVVYRAFFHRLSLYLSPSSCLYRIDFYAPNETSTKTGR